MTEWQRMADSLAGALWRRQSGDRVTRSQQDDERALMERYAAMTRLTAEQR